jgi:hypothetical protein
MLSCDKGWRRGADSVREQETWFYAYLRVGFPHLYPRFMIGEQALPVAHKVFVRAALDFVGRR